MRGAYPVVAIVGRPNVGKSTLFNRLCGKRHAIVGNRPGVTIDRLEKEWRIGKRKAVLVDTGGIGSGEGELATATARQVDAALAVADVVLFVLDGKEGLTVADEEIGNRLRRSGLPVIVVVNKSETRTMDTAFYQLGMGEPVFVSAEHGLGMDVLCQRLEQALPDRPVESIDIRPPEASIAVVGRPNVGKSTLINAWLGHDRLVVSEVPGTTRDAVDVEMIFDGKRIRLVDTAGQRKRGRVKDFIEIVTRIKAIQALRRADAAVVLIDGEEGIVEQDVRMVHLAMEQGCAAVVAVNKCDLLSPQDKQHLMERLHFRLRGLEDVPVLTVSAKQKKGVFKLLECAYGQALRNRIRIPTAKLNRWLSVATERHPHPEISGKRVKLKYCVQTGQSPPVIKCFCNRPSLIRKDYLRFLEKELKRHFGLEGVPVRFQFESGTNPYLERSRN